MELHRLPADEAAVRRYVEELWIPYHRDLEAAVERHALDDEVDLVPAETEFRLDRLESASYRLWVAVDPADRSRSGSESADADVDLATVDGEFAGFVTADVDEAPSVFERPDRVTLGDIYVRESHRGTGLARDLVDRVAEYARGAGCAEVALDVDVDNGRAIGFYEKLGFEPYRHRMAVPVDDL